VLVAIGVWVVASGLAALAMGRVLGAGQSNVPVRDDSGESRLAS
jgi:hypothetical protein